MIEGGLFGLQSKIGFWEKMSNGTQNPDLDCKIRISILQKERTLNALKHLLGICMKSPGGAVVIMCD